MRESVRRQYEAYAAAAAIDQPMHVGWPSVEYQAESFRVLLKLAGSSAGGLLHDAGCGVGDLIPYLKEETRYIGSDGYLPSLSAAKARFPTRAFIGLNLESDILPACDLVLANGTFAFYSQKTVFQLIRRLYESSAKALVFTLLTSNPEKGHIAHDPDQVLRFCRRLTSQVDSRIEYTAGASAFSLHRV